MTQSTDLLLSDQAGAGFRSELNSIIAAIASSHKGGSAPSYAVTGIVWLDDTTSPWVVKQFDGADWIVKGKLDPTTNKFKMSNSADAADLTELPTMKQLQNSAGIYGVTTGASNAYALDLGTGFRPTAYAAGQEFRVKFNHANTGDCTLNVMGSAGTLLGAKDLKLPNGDNPPAGAIPADAQATARYDGTNFVLLGSSSRVLASFIDSESAPDGHVLTSDGAGGAAWEGLPTSGIVVSRVAMASSGTYTKPADLLYVDVEVIGGGGSGGGSLTGYGSSGGGGGGGYAKKLIAAASLGTTETVSVGGVSGTSSFGAHCSATGGGTGGNNTSGGGSAAGGGAGSGVGGDINIAGTTGRTSLNASPVPGTINGNTVQGGDGGASILGGGGNGAKVGVGGGATTASGSSGTTYGAGGGGGANLNTSGTRNGGPGVQGIVIITEYRRA